MKNYLDNILKGFKPVNSEVVLDCETRQTPNFVVVDIDQDGMPELVFAYQYQGERHIGILKKENMQWYLFNVSLEKNQKAIGLGNLVHILDGVKLTSKDVGKVMSMQDLLGYGDQAFVSFIDNTLNHGVVMQTPATPSNFNPLETTPSQQSVIGNLTVEETQMTGAQIIQQSGPLPSPENVNTPAAQQALSQNVITPIMSANNGGQNQALNQTNINQINMNQTEMTGAQIIQQSGALPAPENVNTPMAQQALSQNVITPIMSVTETNEVINNTPSPNEAEAEPSEDEEPQITTTIINGSNSINSNGIALDQEVIDFAQADVTGDGMLDSIYLVADRPRPNNPEYVENVGLKVISGNKLFDITFPYNNGYSPILFVGDLTGDGIDDVLINIFAGGNEGFLTSYAYTFANDMPMLLSDSKIFNDIQTGTVKYDDNYRVNIQTNNPPRIYTIDISDRDPDYLAMLYNEDGTLRRPTEGTLLGLVSLHPVDYEFNGDYNLSAVQRVIGIDNLDTLGLVETYFTWQPANNRFEPFAQYFSILGRPL